MVVADVRREVVLVDDLAHVGEDLVGLGDRLAPPRLEDIAERVEIAVGSDAGIRVRDPGPAEAVLGFEHGERRARQVTLDVDRGSDSGDARADDQDIEVLVWAFGHGRAPWVGARAPR